MSLSNLNMNIGIVTTWFERGAAYVSKQFENELEGSFKVFIYARGGEYYAKGDPQWNKANVTWGKRSHLYRSTQIYLPHFKEWIRQNKIDLIIFNEQHEWKPVIECTKLGVITGAYIDYYKNETVPLFKAYDFLICNTKRHHSVFSWHPQAFYVPWGTNTELFKPLDHPRKDTKLVFFHSCGMNPKRKGTDLLLKAFMKVDRSQSRLVIHSQIPIKNSQFVNQRLISQLLDEGSLNVIERSVHAPGLYHLGDVYVYPTRLEGIGLTIAEAISCSLPVIVTDEQPMNEFVQSPDAGLLIKVDHKVKRADDYYWPQSICNVQSIVDNMSFYIDMKHQISEYKIKARNYAIQNLDWKKNFNSFKNIIEKIKKINTEEKEEAMNSAIIHDKSRTISELMKDSLAYRKLRFYFKDYLR